VQIAPVHTRTPDTAAANVAPVPPQTQNSSNSHPQVLRVSAFSVGLVYGSWHLSSLKSRAAKAAAKVEAAGAAGHH
jgi:hypothetical protein